MTDKCIHRHTKEDHPNCFPKCAFYFTDTQMPFHDPRLLKLILGFAKNTLKPDKVIHGGDLLDAKSFGAFEAKNSIEQYVDCVSTNYKIANKLLDEMCDINPEATLDLMEGNHDYRIYKHSQQHPAFMELLGIEKNLKLKERGINLWLWKKPREGLNKLRPGNLAPLKLGKLHVYHGLRFNQYHAQYNIAENTHSVLYGDVHDFQMASGRRHDRSDRHIAYSIGHCCDESLMEWKHGKASNWIQGFAVIYYFPKSGVFTVYPIPVTNYQFIWNKKLYKG